MWKIIIFISLSLLSSLIQAAEGKLLATPGVSQIEGAGGGGLVPLAQLSGYASRDEMAVNAFCSRADVDDYRLDVCGAQLNLYDRVELSLAEQAFDVEVLDLTIRQRVFGMKVRLYGDVVYSRFPMLSAGLQYKKLHDPLVANVLGAKEDAGTDFYLATSKLHLGAVGGLNWLWNVALRSTDANQTGLLGFGADGQSREWVWEGTTALLLGRHVAVGTEYRQKPDNLGLKEEDWKSVFVAWFPNKHVSVTAAYIDLGEIAGLGKQTGSYLSITGYF